MTRHVLPLALAVALTAALTGQAAQEPQRARLLVRLPPDAELYVDGVRFTRPGLIRTIETPPLEPGQKYYYELRAEYERDGRKQTEQKKVAFQAGETREILFGEPTADAGPAAPPLPKVATGPGTLVVARAEEQDGDVAVKLTTPEFRPETRTRTVQRDGKQFEEAYTVYAIAIREIALKGDDVQAYRKDGTPVPVAELPRLLARPTQVLLATQGKIDPYFLGLVRDDALMLVVEGAKFFGRPQGRPAPGQAAPPTAVVRPKAAPKAAPRIVSNAVHASPTLAGLDESGQVVVRQYQVAFVVPAPFSPKDGDKPAPPSGPTARERLLYFKAEDIQAFDLDGNPVAEEVWRKALAQETPVLFGGYRFAAAPPPGPGPRAAPAPKGSPVAFRANQDGTPNAPGKPSLPVDPLYKQVYRPDTLILQGANQPVKQGPGKEGVELRKAQSPQPAVAVVSDGNLRVIQRSGHSHAIPITVKVKQKGTDEFATATVPIQQTVEYENTRQIPVEHARFFTNAGKEVPADALAGRLAVETPVLVFGSSQPDPLYLRLARPDALIVSIPVPLHGGHGAVMPASPPPAPPPAKKGSPPSA